MNNIEEICKIASSWWTNVIKNPKMDNGDESQAGMLINMLATLNTSKITPEQQKQFKQELYEKIIDTIKDYEDNNIMWLDVDYGPNKYLLEYMGVNVKEQRDEKFSKWYQEQIERQNKEDEKKKEFKKSIYNPITIPFDILTESFENKDNESLKLIVDTCQKINDLLKYLKNKNI